LDSQVAKPQYLGLDLPGDKSEFPGLVIWTNPYHDAEGVDDHTLMIYPGFVGVVVARTQKGLAIKMAAALTAEETKWIEL
jgi:hypothetical protein